MIDDLDNEKLLEIPALVPEKVTRPGKYLVQNKLPEKFIEFERKVTRAIGSLSDSSADESLSIEHLPIRRDSCREILDETASEAI